MSRAAGGLVAALVLAACGPAGGAPPADRHAAVATISVIADFVEQVGGEHVDVTPVVPVGGDPHTHEPVPSDARLVADADIVFANGLGLERWLSELVEAGARGPIVTVTAALEPHAVDAPRGGGVDPHLWMDPVFAASYVDEIEAALASFDPARAADYRDGADAARARLAALDAWIEEQVALIPAGRRKLVATHDAFRYFGERYGFEVVGTLWGTSTEREPSASEIRALIDAVRSSGVPVVFVETTVNPRLMERVARDAGVDVGRPLYGDSVGPPGSGAEDYEGMMRANVEAIVDGLAP